jgi:hypothetical protein
MSRRKKKPVQQTLPVATRWDVRESEVLPALAAGWEQAVGIEREPDYAAIARARLTYWIDKGRRPEYDEKVKVDPRQIALFEDAL